MLQSGAYVWRPGGPAIAGFAVALGGVGIAFVFDAASFAVAALALWFVRSGATAVRPAEPDGVPAAAAVAIATPTPDLEAVQSADRPPASISGALVEGIRSVLGDPIMRSIVILATAANLAFTGPTVVGLPWLVLVGFGGDALALGLLFAAFGAGSLAGPLLGGPLPPPRRFRWVLVALPIWAGIGLGANGVAPEPPGAPALL